MKVTLARNPDTWMPIFPTANCGIFHFAAQPTAAGAERGYVGMWEKINFAPYETDASTLGKQAR